MDNPLFVVYDWFIAFMTEVVPFPVYALLLLALALFMFSSMIRWFL